MRKRATKTAKAARTLAVLAVVLGTGLAAADPVRLDLPGALARARAQALEVTAAGARQQAAEAQLRQARAFRLPTVQLQEMWSRTDSPAEAFAFQLNQERFSFPAFTQSDPNDPDLLSTGMTRLEVSLPVYTGGELSGRIEQARLNAVAAASRSAWIADSAALAAAEAWVQLAQVREQAKLLEGSRETVAHHVELARSYVEQGMIVRSELLRAEVELARIDEMLAEARGNARIAEANLSFRLDADPATTWELDPLPAEPAVGPGRDEWLAFAGNRPDLEAARRMLAAGELEESVRRAALLPRVGLTLRHDLFDDRPLGTHGDSTTVMAMVGWELWSGGRHRAAAAAARAEVEAARSDVERMARGIRLEVEQAWEGMQTAIARRRTAERSLAAAREVERIVGERFRSGVAKTLDLLDAATARREAETRELVARADAQLAAFRLAAKAGKPPEAALPSSQSSQEVSR
jgi:outer membrane protein TolC